MLKIWGKKKITEKAENICKGSPLIKSDRVSEVENLEMKEAF